MINGYTAFFNCRASDYDVPGLRLFILVGCGRSFLSVVWPTGVQLAVFFYSVSAPRDLHRRTAYRICEFSFLIRHGGYHIFFS